MHIKGTKDTLRVSPQRQGKVGVYSQTFIMQSSLLTHTHTHTHTSYSLTPHYLLTSERPLISVQKSDLLLLLLFCTSFDHFSMLIQLVHSNVQFNIVNKADILNDLFFDILNLVFLFLTETWQQNMEFIHLNELCVVDCSFIGTPCLSGCGGGVLLSSG